MFLPYTMKCQPIVQKVTLPQAASIESSPSAPQQMATAALSPATVSLRLKPLSSTVRFLSLYQHHQPKPTKLKYQIILAPLHHPPLPQAHFNYLNNSTAHRRCFSTVVSATVSPGEVVEKSKTESIEERVGEFRKRLRIVDIKGGESEGVDRLGQTLTVRGWVRTLRIQSSVTFIEVIDIIYPFIMAYELMIYSSILSKHSVSPISISFLLNLFNCKQ